MSLVDVSSWWILQALFSFGIDYKDVWNGPVWVGLSFGMDIFILADKSQQTQ